MSLRFRRSVRLFPGVRLNFSASGVSTTVGVRGATVTMGRHGTHAHLGLPGTGLSYRTRIGPPAPNGGRGTTAVPAGHRPERPETPPSPAPAPDGSSVQVRSAEVDALTSEGLSELKRLINEAAGERRRLTRAVAADRRLLEAAKGRLRFARTFIIRIFTRKSAPDLLAAVDAAAEILAARTAELDGCAIDVDFALDRASNASYAALIRSFEALSSCDRIWDITAVQATDRVRERTVATTAVTRKPVSFDLAASEIVQSPQPPMRMGNASGRDIFLYPGFLMMKDGSGDFGLVEYQDVKPEFSQSRFVEEERVPSDTEVVGQTWKKANKDGSPDRRFRDNHAIPIARYGEIVLRSPTGLFEAYLFSQFDKSSAFNQALLAHKRALVDLVRNGGVSPDTAVAMVVEEASDPDEAEPMPQAPNASRTPTLVLDWLALAGGAMLLAAGMTTTPRQPTPPVTASPSTIAPSPAAAPAKARPHKSHLARAEPKTFAQPGSVAFEDPRRERRLNALLENALARDGTDTTQRLAATAKAEREHCASRACVESSYRREEAALQQWDGAEDIMRAPS